MTPSRLFEFSWPVHQSGYTWGEPLPGSYHPEEASWYWRLVPADSESPIRRYEPLRKHPALFRTFADIDPGFEGIGIVQFANQYGLLGRPPAGYRRDFPGRQVADGHLDDWDIHFMWRQAIQSMRDLVHLWDLTRARDRARLKVHILWEGNYRVTYDNRADLTRLEDRVVQVIASRDVREDWLEFFTPGDVATPALFYLMGMVNAWLIGLTSPHLQWDEREGGLVTRIVPSSLLGALWLQFHQAISGQKNYRQCEVCKSWFEISPKVNRASKLYCGDACRSQAYRDRQKRARQLHEEGRSFVEIARELGSDVPTVKKWVSGKKE